ncbi:MAG TPA: hypothetical protein VK971_03490 [Thiohalobacter sp.]|nr:hypothetical protein [Thiohalobacter sp.]
MVKVFNPIGIAPLALEAHLVVPTAPHGLPINIVIRRTEGEETRYERFLYMILFQELFDEWFEKTVQYPADKQARRLRLLRDQLATCQAQINERLAELESP